MANARARLFATNPKALLRGAIESLKVTCQNVPFLEENGNPDNVNLNELIATMKTCGNCLANSINKKLDDGYNRLQSRDAQVYINVVTTARNAIINPIQNNITALGAMCDNEILDERERHWMTTLFYGLLSLSSLPACFIFASTLTSPLLIGFLVFIGITATLRFAGDAYNSVSSLVTPGDLARDLHQSIVARHGLQ